MLVADAAPLWRDGLARLLADAGVDVLARVGTAQELEAAAVRLRPDAVVVDPRLDGGTVDDGVAALQRIRRADPEVAVLVLADDRPRGGVGALGGGRGGLGHLAKSRIATAADLVRAVECVAMGGVIADQADAADATGGPCPLDALSRREREVLALIAEGASNAAIAALLNIAGKTVDSHVGRILVKLGLGEDVGVNRRVRAALLHLEATRR